MCATIFNSVTIRASATMLVLQCSCSSQIASYMGEDDTLYGTKPALRMGDALKGALHGMRLAQIAQDSNASQ